MITANREKTFAAIVSIMKHMHDNCDQYGGTDAASYAGLPVDRKLQLAMQFYQCERGRWQKAKMVFDVFAHIGPLIISLAALWFATK
jgi:hypothetical protein